MKKLLIIVLIVISIGLGIVAIHNYNNVLDSRAAAANAQQQAKEAQEAAEEIDRQLQRAQSEAIIEECQDALERYQTLTPAERAKTAAPDCAIEKLQVE